MHVTAQDKGTGKSTDITITSSTNLSEDEIDKAVKDAEKFAEEDKKRKEKIDNKNKLDGMIFSVEQTMKEAGDKLDENDKAALQAAVDTAGARRWRGSRSGRRRHRIPSVRERSGAARKEE